MIAAVPASESQRLKVLHSLEILDTSPEAAFDAFTRTAQLIAGTEIALVSLLDEHRQWFKASIGLDVPETSRDFAFCAHTILSDEPLCVENATQDRRFSDNPFVLDEPRIRAYAGAPITVDGQNIGTVCAISAKPRKWTPKVRAALASLADSAAQHLETRRRLAFKDRLIQTTSDAVLAADGEGNIVFWNAAAERLLGWTALEAVGRSVDLIAPDPTKANHHHGFAQVRTTGRDGFGGRPVELNALHKDGHEVPIELTLATWRGGGGVTVAAVIRDCSERVALAGERAANLAKSRFLATMSHEIRTPLNGLLGLTEVLALTNEDPAQGEILEVMRQSGETLEKLVADILDYANLEAGGRQLTPEVFDLSSLLSEMIQAHRPAANAKQLALSWSGPDWPVMVTADRARLARILGKLIGNAVEFTPAGAVFLAVEYHTPDMWRFEITDTGPGFCPTMIDHLFQPFHQGDDSATRVHGGTGLGLALSKELAQDMGGSLRAENRVEGGARLIFSVPLPFHETSTSTKPQSIQ